MNKNSLFPTQISFDILSEVKKIPPLLPTQKKPPFTPPTLENGLSKGRVNDCAMMWLRMLTKQATTNPKAYLSFQRTEIQFKRTGFDQTILVRDALLQAHFNKNNI